jgi:hypothetical protein
MLDCSNLNADAAENTSLISFYLTTLLQRRSSGCWFRTGHKWLALQLSAAFPRLVLFTNTRCLPDPRDRVPVLGSRPIQNDTQTICLPATSRGNATSRDLTSNQTLVIPCHFDFSHLPTVRGKRATSWYVISGFRFWAVTQRRKVLGWRRFGNSYWSYLHRLNDQIRMHSSLHCVKGQ